MCCRSSAMCVICITYHTCVVCYVCYMCRVLCVTCASYVLCVMCYVYYVCRVLCVPCVACYVCCVFCVTCATCYALHGAFITYAMLLHVLPWYLFSTFKCQLWRYMSTCVIPVWHYTVIGWNITLKISTDWVYSPCRTERGPTRWSPWFHLCPVCRQLWRSGRSSGCPCCRELSWSWKRPSPGCRGNAGLWGYLTF